MILKSVFLLPWLLMIAIAAAESPEHSLTAPGTPPGGWQVNVHYKILPGADARRTNDIDVVEFFGYKCPHCKAFEPYLLNWKQEKPSRVSFTEVPVSWGHVDWGAYARLHYTLKELGRLDLRQEVFDEVHVHHNPLATTDAEESFKRQLAFAQAHNIDPVAFKAAYYSRATEADLKGADDLVTSDQVDGVPALVIAGKYWIRVDMVGGPENMLALAKDLVALEQSQQAQSQQLSQATPNSEATTAAQHSANPPR